MFESWTQVLWRYHNYWHELFVSTDAMHKDEVAETAKFSILGACQVLGSLRRTENYWTLFWLVTAFAISLMNFRLYLARILWSNWICQWMTLIVPTGWPRWVESVSLYSYRSSGKIIDYWADIEVVCDIADRHMGWKKHQCS